MMKLQTILTFVFALLIVPAVFAAPGDVHITPENPTVADDLYCYAEDYADDEASAEWFINGNILLEVESNLLDSFYTAVGDEVTCVMYFETASGPVPLDSPVTVTILPVGGEVELVPEIYEDSSEFALSLAVDDVSLDICSTTTATVDLASLVVVTGPGAAGADVGDISWHANLYTGLSDDPLLAYANVDADGLLMVQASPYAVVGNTGVAYYALSGNHPDTSFDAYHLLRVNIDDDDCVVVSEAPVINLPASVVLTMTSAENTVLHTFYLDDHVTDDGPVEDITWEITQAFGTEYVQVTYYAEETEITLMFSFLGLFDIPITITLPARTAILSAIPENSIYFFQHSYVTFVATDADGNSAEHTMNVIVRNPYCSAPLDPWCHNDVPEDDPGDDDDTGLDRPDKIKGGEAKLGVYTTDDLSVARVQAAQWKSAYNAGDNVHLLIKLQNRGIVDHDVALTIFSPTMGSMNEYHVSSGVDEKSTKWTQAFISIPADATPGWHVVRVIASNSHGDATSSYWRFQVA